MEFIREVLGIISQYYSYLLSGVGYTMLIALIGTAAGFLIGLITGVIRTAPRSKNAVVRVLHKIVNAIIAVYIEVFRGTPMMVQAMVIYWGYAFLNDGATLPLIPAGLFIVSINTGAYMAEIVRGAQALSDRRRFCAQPGKRAVFIVAVHDAEKQQRACQQRRDGDQIRNAQDFSRHVPDPSL